MLDADPQTAFQYAKEERQKANWLWKIGLLVTVLCLIEIPMPPLTPMFAFFGAALAGGVTGHFLLRAKRLPIREALLLAQARDGQLSLTHLCVDLELDPVTAKVLLNKMQQQGLLQVDDDALLDDGDLRYLLKS